jgi:hypothetical protein
MPLSPSIITDFFFGPVMHCLAPPTRPAHRSALREGDPSSTFCMLPTHVFFDLSLVFLHICAGIGSRDDSFRR